ncbi:MAG: cytochrome-c oxidase, cbb3-type subunit II [Alphaproteobacteria bacterium]|nr:MAG: cytochrome-c oxidase, cbb3-type subunit II [Alphaproteobacteria bacterium]TAF14458.1 MAG: cytochrome-c oxidase, cbb3-type subunit II [Alphaproteobacteria bacterium]TAF38761.1 MAG: cytochrome-c oxidase, cbb3-type subunit II [Alphaproteobacteria bacterium]TAF77611.1 MAG: cytochrome-c oxidase, cbb3-type subunit II [Alphaproteobacteria bacterium]
MTKNKKQRTNHHHTIEKRSILMLLLVIVTISVGGIVEILPLFRKEVTIEPVEGVRPYTPLELMGQNIYIREGCYNCHSQQIRPLRDEVERYGHYSLAAESMYDHPFQWGSKRTGPDLARVGGKYSDEWQVQHLMHPQSVVPESIMPAYAHLSERLVNLNDIRAHLSTLRTVGVPYSDEMIKNAYHDAIAQQMPEGNNLDGLKARYGEKVNIRNFDGDRRSLPTEMDALVAYLQVLGTMVEFTDYDPAHAKKAEVQP